MRHHPLIRYLSAYGQRLPPEGHAYLLPADACGIADTPCATIRLSATHPLIVSASRQRATRISCQRMPA
ncbi:MAG: hypothetical protein ACE5MB_10175, partial [Anaerolineae bacterium]